MEDFHTATLIVGAFLLFYGSRALVYAPEFKKQVSQKDSRIIGMAFVFTSITLAASILADESLGNLLFWLAALVGTGTLLFFGSKSKK